MSPAWKDGVAALLRAARTGSRLALDEAEERVVKLVILTALLATEAGR